MNTTFIHYIVKHSASNKPIRVDAFSCEELVKANIRAIELNESNTTPSTTFIVKSVIWRRKTK